MIFPVIRLLLPSTNIWCNTKVVGKVILLPINKSYSNLDIEDQMFLEFALYPPSGWKRPGQKKN